MDSCDLVNQSRGILVYTGEYKGTRISLASHGMGGFSLSTVVEELSMLGSRTIVRYGTAGTLTSEIKLGEYFIPSEGLHGPGGIYNAYDAEYMFLTPENSLVLKTLEVFSERNLPFHRGKIYASEAFWSEDADFVKKRKEEGIAAMDAETPVLFMLGKIRRLSTTAVLVASNAVSSKEAYLPADELNKRIRGGAEAFLETLRRV